MWSAVACHHIWNPLLYFKDVCEYLSALSLPEVRWQFTKPIEVPLKRRETPTAPLFPVTTKKKTNEFNIKKYQYDLFITWFVLLG